METTYEKRTYFENENFKVFLENINDHVFIHVAINKFTKNILKDIKAIWAEVVTKMYFLGYEELFAHTKDNRIVKMIGGAEHVGTYKEHEVWKWDLN